MPTRYSGYARLTFISATALIAIAMLPLMLAPGVPAFEQDWQWPVHRAQCLPYASLGAQPWNSAGIGAPQSYPEAWLPYAAGGALCAIAGPHIGLLLYLLLLLGLASAGIAWLAKTYDLAGIASLAVLAVYLGNPVVLNELHAGHLHFILSYAMLPVFLAAIRSETIARRPLVLGVLLGLTSAQQQFFFFGLVLGTLVGWSRGSQWFVRIALPALAVALFFTAPQWILAVTHPVSAQNLNAYRPLLHWEESQSVPFADAIRFFGYIGGYDLALSPLVRAIAWVFPIATLGGAIVAFLRRSDRAWVAAVICALLGVIGTHGPAVWLLLPATEHSSFGALFRELYTFEAVAAIGYAVLIGLLIQSLMTAPGLRRRGAVGLTGLILIAGVCIASYASRGITAFEPSALGNEQIARIASAPGFGRYLQVPSALPQSLAGARTTGLSPFTLPIGSHASALDTQYEPPYSSVVATQTRGAPEPAQLLEALGVSQVLDVPGVVQASNYEPQLRGIFPPIRAHAQSTWSLNTAPAQHAVLLPPASLVEIIAGRTFDVNGLAGDVNPRSGWARTALWNNLPAWIYDRPAGVFTVKPALRAPAQGRSTVIGGSANGKLRAGGCHFIQRLDAHYSSFDCYGPIDLRGTPPIAISEIVAGSIRFVRPAPGGSATVINDRGWRLELDVHAPANAVLEVRERQDSGWTCNGCDGVAARGDGYANAWILPKGANGRITLEFTPARVYYLALGISIALLVAALIDVLLLLQRQGAFRRFAAAATASRATYR